MSRIAAAAAVLVVGWSASLAVANADPVPPPPPGPKTSFGNGTYKVGTDITPGVYQSAGPVGDGACYWKRVNGDGIVANAITKKAQTVQIEAGDTGLHQQRVPGLADDRRRPAWEAEPARGARPTRQPARRWRRTGRAGRLKLAKYAGAVRDRLTR